MMEKLIYRLEEVDRSCISEVGGKAAYLGELIQLGMPVPSGFVVSTEAFDRFLTESKHSAEIRGILKKAFELRDIGTVSGQLQKYLAESPVPPQILEHIREYYGSGQRPYIAVRSSANIEDTVGSSFAGQAESYLFIPDFASLIESIKKCWASLFSQTSLLYIISKGFSVKDVKMAVVVQEMVDSDISGVMFTANVLNKNPDQILINSAWGLGETIAGGKIIADEITVRKKPLEIVSYKIGTKELMSVKNEKNYGTVTVSTPDLKRKACSLSNERVIQISKLGMVIEEKMGCPQDIEFAIERGEIKILQTRPITTI